MKKIILLLLTFSFIGFSLATAKEESETKGDKDRLETRIDFWNTVIEVLKYKGFKEDSPEIKRAQTYLKRAHTEKEHLKETPKAARNILSTLFGKGTKKEESKEKEKKKNKKQSLKKEQEKK